MRIREYLFIVIMVALTVATSVRVYQIENFKKNSQKFSFVVSSEDSQEIKQNLENITFQPVDEEVLEDGSLRLTFRCPPEKVQNLWKMMGFRENRFGN